MNKVFFLNMLKSFLFIFLIIFTACHKEKRNNDWHEILQSSNDYQLRVYALLSAVRANADSIGNSQKADSFLKESIIEANLSNDPYLISQTFLLALEKLPAERSALLLANEYYNTAKYNATLTGNNELIDQVNLSMSAFWLAQGDIRESQAFLNMISGQSESTVMAQLKKQIGQAAIYSKAMMPYEELKLLLDVMYQSMEFDADSMYNVALDKISDFYYNNKQYHRSLEFIDNLQNSLFPEEIITDSTKLYFLELKRLDIYNQDFDSYSRLNLASRIIEYSRLHKYQILEDMAQSSLRTALINTVDLDQIKNYYEKHPDYLRELSNSPTQRSIYLRMKAYLALNAKKIDSAKYYFNEAGNYLQGTNKYFKANYYKRKGDFYKAINENKNLIANYEMAYMYDDQLFRQLEILDTLNDYFKKSGNNTKLLYYLGQKDSLNQILVNLKNEENIRQLEFNTLLAKKNYEHEKAEALIKSKHNLQNQILAMVVVFAFMFLILISNLKVPKWWVRSMGYISFIMFFEFIILIFDQRIHELTHGSPVKILLIKVILVSGLFPLHHWIEHTFINMLLKNDKMNSFKEWIHNKWTAIWHRLRGKEDINDPV